MFGRIFAGFCAFSIVSDMFCGVWWGIRGKMQGFAGYDGEGGFSVWADGWERAGLESPIYIGRRNFAEILNIKTCQDERESITDDNKKKN